MTTPAHAIFNLLVLRREHRVGRSLILPIALGAVVPDITMFGFYIYYKWIRHFPESTIWNDLYFRPEWQSGFDSLHSFPLICVGMWMAYRMASRTWGAFFGSMALHSVSDFLLHNNDAHRHFFPLADYRFASPVSYWDPQYFGQIMAPLEALMVIAGSITLARAHPSRGARTLLIAVGALYLLGMGYALLVWANA